MNLQAQILSLNIGGPAPMLWEGRSLVSSMLKTPVKGPIEVNFDRVLGNSFTHEVHGSVDSILYAYGLTSAQSFIDELGLKTYQPGSTGETLTVDHLDEKEVSIGDVFQIGEVKAQAVYPRIPCGKVNYRMQNANGQKAMQDAGRSGIYFRILKPGKIQLSDKMIRVELAQHRISIFELYAKMVKREDLSQEQMKIAVANGTFPDKAKAKFNQILGF